MSAQKKKQSYQWIAKASELGLFLPLIRTRKRLWLSTAIIDTLAMLLAWQISDWIRQTSGYPIANIFAIASVLIIFIIASYFNAVFLGDLVFPAQWRERVLLHQPYQARSVEEEAEATQEYSLPFLLLIAGSIIAMIYLSQFITHDFFGYYQRLGFAISLMRSEDPKDRLMGVEEMAKVFYEDRSWEDPELHAQLIALLKDKDLKVRAAAIYAIGRIQVLDAGPLLIEMTRTERDPDLLREMAMALGRMKYPSALGPMVGWIQEGPPALRLGTFQGAFFWGHPVLMQAIGEWIEAHVDEAKTLENSMRFALYALKAGGHNAPSQPLLALLKHKDIPLTLQCAASDALRYVATREDIPHIQMLFKRHPKGQKCKAQQWKIRYETARTLVDPEYLRAKWIRAVGNRKDYRTFNWFVNINEDPSELREIRNIAGIYGNEMYKAYERECSDPMQRQREHCRIDALPTP